MSKTYYLHTLNGSPAQFHDGRILYASFYGKANPLASSLKQIRKEQAISKRSCENRDFCNPNDFKLGYVRVST